MNNTFELPDSLERFIQNHSDKYKNYSEAIIYPNKSIEYAVPSHQMKMLCVAMNITNEAAMLLTDEYYKALKSITIESSPLHYCIEISRCISI